MAHFARHANYMGSLTMPVPCFCPLKSLNQTTNSKPTKIKSATTSLFETLKLIQVVKWSTQRQESARTESVFFKKNKTASHRKNTRCRWGKCRKHKWDFFDFKVKLLTQVIFCRVKTHLGDPPIQGLPTSMMTQNRVWSIPRAWIWGPAADLEKPWPKLKDNRYMIYVCFFSPVRLSKSQRNRLFQKRRNWGRGVFGITFF